MAELAALDAVPGVYLMVQAFGDRSTVYVGSSTNVPRRFQEHIGAALGLGYYIRDDDGEWHPKQSPVAAFWDRLGNLEDELRMVASSLRRTQFFMAHVPADRRVNVERALHADIATHAVERGLASDNGAKIGRAAGQVETGTIHNEGSQEVHRYLSRQVPSAGL